MTEHATNTVIIRLDEIASLLRALVSRERPPRLLRLKPAAAYLSISPAALRTLIQKKEIAVIKLGPDGTPWLVDVRSLDDFIERNKV